MRSKRERPKRLPKQMWKASLAFTPSVARLKSRAISSPVTLPRAGSSSWMKSAPAATSALQLRVDHLGEPLGDVDHALVHLARDGCASRT